MSEETKALEQVVAEATTVAKKASNRRQFRNDEWTEEQVAAQLALISSPTIPVTPEGLAYVKLATLTDACRVAGVPISKMVRATGGDRGMYPPIEPLFQVTYVGRVRYLHPEVLTQGMLKLGDPAWGGSTRKPRAKKEIDPNAPVKVKKEKVAKASKTGSKAEAPQRPASTGVVWGEEQ